MKPRLAVALIFALVPGFLVFAGASAESESGQEAPEPMGTDAAAEGTGTAQTLDNYRVYPTPAAYEEATGRSISSYQQSPMLDALVASGELPPVEERLPSEPCVIQPTDRIGTYGGTLTGIRSEGESYAGSPAHLSLILPTGEYAMTLAKGWEVSDDNRSLTIYLREGARWSDGAPFTADDIVFYWNDIVLNKELTPALSPNLRIGGEPYSIVKLDDYTVRFVGREPNYGIVTLIPKVALSRVIQAPKHYLSRFHIDYNENANELARSEGFDNWAQLFLSKNRPILFGGDGPKANPERPTLGPWQIVDIGPDKTELERNPYFWAVDVEGNQLPYIDREVEFVVESNDSMLFRVMNGDIDFRVILFWDAPAVIDNEERGNYRVLTTYMGNELAWPNVTFNLATDDPVLGPIIRDVRFRRAMSVAIDRQEILDGPWLGVGRICQTTVRDTDPLFREEWLTNHAQFDLDMANRLLDEMGLEWDSNEEYRLRPDGERLQLFLITMDWNWVPTEPMIDHWKRVGVEVIPSVDDWNLYVEKEQSGEFHLATWTTYSQNFESEISGGGYHPSAVGNAWAPPWGVWWDTGGEEGTEPPDWVKTYLEARDRFLTAKNEEEYLEYGTEVWQWLADYLPVIGTVGYNPFPMAVHNRLQNVWPFNVGSFEQEGQKLQWFLEEQ